MALKIKTITKQLRYITVFLQKFWSGEPNKKGGIHTWTPHPNIVQVLRLILPQERLLSSSLS